MSANLPEPYSAPTILLVNDNNDFLRTFAALLESYGFMVFSAESGYEALEVAKTYAGFIDVLVTDLLMEGMNGIQLVDNVHRAQPDLPVVFVSGWSLDEVLSELSDNRTLNYRHEYLDISEHGLAEQLSRVIRRLLKR